MNQFLQTSAAQVCIWTAVACTLFAVAYFVVSKARGLLSTDQTSGRDTLVNFREMHARGELSDKEYRTIKTMLSQRLQQELKGTDEEG